MNSTSKFQLIFTGVFAVFILIGVSIFAFYKGGSGSVQSRVIVWGTEPQLIFNNVYSKSTLYKDKTISLTYVEKNLNTFNEEFIEALASGVGPDVVFLPQEEILKNKSKLFVIPFATYSERNFATNYTDSAKIFVLPNGILAIPLTIDPLVMYWNKDTFTNNGESEPPTYWDQFYNIAQRFTVKDGALNIKKATVALGEYQNITNAKDIVSALLMQAGTPIVASSGGRVRSVLSEKFDLVISPGISALTFYTEFSNPAKPYYSWNRSLPDSQSMFVSGDLAIYFGFSSEYKLLKLKNPNLNFDVSRIPQSRNTTKASTFGRLNAMAIVKNSKNVSGSYKVVNGLTSGNTGKTFADLLGLPPARRDLLAYKPTDTVGPVFYNSALLSLSWFDVDSRKTSETFKNMIEQITSGKNSLSNALNQANAQLDNLFK